MDWSAEDAVRNSIYFKLLPKLWLETNGVQDHKQYMFILHLLGKENLHKWESFPLDAPNNNDKDQPDHMWEAFKGSFRQTIRFRNYRQQNFNIFYQ